MKNCIVTLILFVSVIFISCMAKNKNIQPLDKYTGMSYTDMLKELGPPVDKTAYTIGNAPDKSWNYTELFSLYPNIHKNENIQIMEVIWDAGQYSIFACYHMVNGVNRCLVAKKIRKGVQY